MILLLECDCGERLQVNGQSAGATISCPSCGAELPVSGEASAAPNAPPIQQPPNAFVPGPPASRDVLPVPPPPIQVVSKETTRKVPTWLWFVTAGTGATLVAAVIVAVVITSREAPSPAREIAKVDAPPATPATETLNQPPEETANSTVEDVAEPPRNDEETSSSKTPSKTPADQGETEGQPEDELPVTDDLSKTKDEVVPNDAERVDSADDLASSPRAYDPSNGALRRAAESVLKMSETDKFDWGFVFPLITHAKVVGHKEYEVRYREVIKKVPVYQNKYKSVAKVVPVRQGYTVRLKRVVHRKIVGRKKIGSRPVKTLVADKNGPIVRIHKRAIFGPGGVNTEPVSWPGNNAMALYALLKVGVPADDPRVSRLTDSLASYLAIYGTGELTWDIAWCLIAFSEHPDDSYDFVIMPLVSRLVAGQITSGSGKDMWGPLCVDPELLVRLFEEFNWIEGQVQRLEAFAKAQPKNAIVQGQLAQAKGLHESLFGQINNVSRYATRLNVVMHGMLIDDELERFGPKLSVAAPPYNLYREVIADLESTSLAVHALRAAHRRGKLPESISLPFNNRQRKPLVPDIEVTPALVRTLEKLAAAQDEDGKWDEMISRQPVEQFAKLQDTVIGPGVDIPESIESRKTPITTAQGCGALEDLIEILGPDVYRPLYAERIARARGRIGTSLRLALEPDPGPDKYWAPYRIMDPRLGGRVELMALLYHLRIDAAALAAKEDLEAYRRLLESVFKTQQVGGLWKTLPYALPYTPGLRERAKVIVKHHHDELRKTKPKVADRYRGASFLPRAYVAGRWLPTADDANRLATLYAMLFLVDQVGEPIDFNAETDAGVVIPGSDVDKINGDAPDIGAPEIGAEKDLKSFKP